MSPCSLAPLHAGQNYFLTGGEAIGLADLAAALTDMTGRRVRYHPISIDEAQRRWEARGFDSQTVGAMGTTGDRDPRALAPAPSGP